MRYTALLAAAGFVAIVAGCTASTPDQTATPAAAPAVATAAASASCVDLSRIREARVIDDRTIDFELRDRTVLRNSLPAACPGLGFDKAFTYATSLSRLCSTDIITVIHSSGVSRGASCGLGGFTAAPAAAPPAG